MAWLPFFIDHTDLPLLRDRLNDDPETAFIIQDCLVHPEASDVAGSTRRGYRYRWKAISQVDHLSDGEHGLWHLPAGSLLLAPDPQTFPATLTSWRDNQPIVADPFAGWIAERPVVEYAEPSFGVMGRGLMRLTLWTRVAPYTKEEEESSSILVSYWTHGYDFLVVSGIAFGGATNAARPETLRWWARFKRWVSKTAVCLRPSPPGINFWAFPSVFRRLESGTKYYTGGFDLGASIREASIRRRSNR